MILNQKQKREIIIKNFSNPSHEISLEKLEEKSGISLLPFRSWGGCGDIIYLSIKGKNKQVEWAFFAVEKQACSLTVASANILCSWIEGKNIREIKKEIENTEAMLEEKNYQLTCSSLEVFADLNKFPSRKECVNLVIRSIKNLLKLQI